MMIREKSCPVCGMDAENSELNIENYGVVYHFCSEQCQENFHARPKLYVGRQAARRLKNKIIKRRIFTIEHPLDQSQRAHLQQALMRLMGICGLRVDRDTISIAYNLLETNAEQIENALIKAGADMGAGWMKRLKRGWVHYTEENELDNLVADDAACCNKPPVKR